VNHTRATAAAGPAIIRAEITALLPFPGILMGPITDMWAPTISPTSNITGRTLVTGRPTLTLTMGRILMLVTGHMLTQAAGMSADITAGTSAECIAASTVAIIAAANRYKYTGIGAHPLFQPINKWGRPSRPAPSCSFPWYDSDHRPDKSFPLLPGNVRTLEQ